MGVSFIVNRKLEMCEKGHGESVKVMIGIPGELNILLGRSSYKNLLEKMNKNGIINVGIEGAPGVSLFLQILENLSES